MGDESVKGGGEQGGGGGGAGGGGGGGMSLEQYQVLGGHSVPVQVSGPGQLPTIAEAAPPVQDLVTYTTYQGTPTDAEGRFCALKRKHSFN